MKEKASTGKLKLLEEALLVDDLATEDKVEAIKVDALDSNEKVIWVIFI